MVSPRKLEEKGPLKRITGAINDVNALAQSMRIQRGLGYSVRHTAHGQVLQLDSRRTDTGVQNASTVQRFIVTSIENDWLGCVKLKPDGTISEDDSQHKVAKPVLLRVSSLAGTLFLEGGYGFIIGFQTPADHGNTRRLVVPADASNPARYVDEILSPFYAIGSEIYATEPEGQTGVIVNGERLTWVDLNVDARHYRPKYTRVAACVVENGQTVTRYMFVAGGPIQP